VEGKRRNTVSRGLIRGSPKNSLKAFKKGKGGWPKKSPMGKMYREFTRD